MLKRNNNSHYNITDIALVFLYEKISDIILAIFFADVAWILPERGGVCSKTTILALSISLSGYLCIMWHEPHIQYFGSITIEKTPWPTF